MDFLGDLPTGFTAGAVVFTASQYGIERRRHRTEVERAARAQAVELSAWTVSDRAISPVPFGVRIANHSHSTFHDIDIHAVLFGNTDLPRISLRVLPPGQYFIRWVPAESQWDYAVSVDEYATQEQTGQLRPYTLTDKYYVAAMHFTDAHDQRWSVDRHMVLRRSSG